jgi:predicted TIM-barrel fold metal-dependent hydrolase
MMHSGEEARTLASVAALDAATQAAMAALPPMISTDSHVMEPDEVWQQLPPRLLEKFRAESVGFTFRGTLPAGASDPRARLADQKLDGIQAEVMFPNNGMAVFGFADIETQQAAFKLYNDFIADFCKVSPKNLFGIPCISVYDMKAGVQEMYRALDMGLVGIMVWQVPDPKLPFTSDHYEPLWAAAAEAGAPVHMHILTGHSYARTQGKLRGIERIRGAVNKKQNDTIEALFDLIFSGVFDRHPKLKLVLAESECGWLPFVLQQWDYYFERFRKFEEGMPIQRKPSQIFEEHVFCTWLEDYSGTRQFTWWGQNNLMWSNDYPHPNMTFPHSRENVVHHIGNLPQDVQRKLIRDNAIGLYGLDTEIR